MSYPKSVQAGIPRLKELKPGYTRLTFGDILYEEKRPIKLINDKDYRLITIKRSRGGMEERGILKGEKILVKSQFEIKENDFIISKRQIVHGACALTPRQFEGSIVSNEYSVLKSKPCLNHIYLKYLAHSIYFQQTCFHSSVGVHIEKMIFKLEDWFRWKIDIPDLNKQEKIASFLTSIDAKIEHLIQKEKLLKKYKKGVMQQIFSQKIRFRADNGSEFPEWEEKNLGEITIQNKKSPLNVNSSSDEGQYPFFTSGDNINRCDAFLVDGLNLLMNDGGVAGIKSYEGKCSYSNHTLSFKANESNYTYYVYYNIQHRLKEIDTKFFVGSGLKNLAKSDFFKYYNIDTPSQEEQIKIGDFLSSIDFKIKQVQKQLDSTEEYKKALLQQMFL